MASLLPISSIRFLKCPLIWSTSTHKQTEYRIPNTPCRKMGSLWRFTINDKEINQYRVPEFYDSRSHCIILLTIIISRVLPIFVHFLSIQLSSPWIFCHLLNWKVLWLILYYKFYLCLVSDLDNNWYENVITVSHTKISKQTISRPRRIWGHYQLQFPPLRLLPLCSHYAITIYSLGSWLG